MSLSRLSRPSRLFGTPAAITAALIATLITPAYAASYVQAPGSTLAFATQYDGETFSGTFPGFQTTLRFDPTKLEDARLDVTIPLAGAKTGNTDRDGTLHGADFFNVAQFAQARYSASTFRKLDNNTYAADGTLELRGIKKPVTLTFTWTAGDRPVLAGKATVKRLDFGVGANDDWKDTATIPDAVAVSTKVILQAAP